MSVHVPVSREQIAGLCQRWKIVEFSLFGSAVRGEFGPESDVDVLVAFAPDAGWSLYDLVNLVDELQALFGRSVDLVERDAIRNPFRRRAILSEREVLYAA
ncbi:MAG: nucleotidyltransferase family protein [Planctomycetota bacterium]